MSGPEVGDRGLTTPYPRQFPPTLHVEGPIALAVMSVDGQQALRDVRRALVTGGRSMLTLTPYGWFRCVGDDSEGGIVAFGVKLTPEIEHRIRTSGGVLSEVEIVTGLEQVRESDEDVQKRLEIEQVQAFTDGRWYAMQQMEAALNGDDAALHRAWEMARKTMAVGKQIRDRAGRPA